MSSLNEVKNKRSVDMIGYELSELINDTNKTLYNEFNEIFIKANDHETIVKQNEEIISLLKMLVGK